MTSANRSRLLRRQVLFWSLAALLFVGLLFVFSSVLLPFVLAMCIAYFLDPVADALERLGLSRLMATLVILVLFSLCLCGALPSAISVITQNREQTGTYMTSQSVRQTPARTCSSVEAAFECRGMPSLRGRRAGSRSSVCYVIRRPCEKLLITMRKTR